MRARRAFEAGYWARLAIAGRVAKQLSAEGIYNLQGKRTRSSHQGGKRGRSIQDHWSAGHGLRPSGVVATNMEPVLFPSEATSDAMLNAWAEQSVPGEEPWLGRGQDFLSPPSLPQRGP